MEGYPAHRVEQLSVIDSPLRVRLVPFLSYQEINRRRKPEYPHVPRQLSDRVTVNGEKWLLDSGPIERSGGIRQPYADDPTSSGQVDFPPEEVRAILEESLQHDRPLLLHAVGDRTTEALLNQMEATGGAKIWSQRRLRIEHGDGLMPDLIPRALNVSIQPGCPLWASCVERSRPVLTNLCSKLRVNDVLNTARSFCVLCSCNLAHNTPGRSEDENLMKAKYSMN